MKLVLAFVIILNSLLFGAKSENNDTHKKSRIEAQIKKEIEKEKKYSKEQIFYQRDNYDFKGAEVNKDSLDSVPNIEVDDFNMDSVYD